MARTNNPADKKCSVRVPAYLQNPIEEDEELSRLADLYEHEPKPQPKGGRPHSYNPKFHPRAAFVLTSEYGFGDRDLSQVFGMKNKNTIWMWRRKYPQFRQAIEDGRDLFNVSKIEKALIRRAVGYELLNQEKARVPIYENALNEKGELILDGKGLPVQTVVGHEMAVVKETIQHVAPDIGAIKFVLKNRNPSRWPDKTSVETSGSIQHTHLHASLSRNVVELDPTKLPTDVLLKLVEQNPDDPITKEDEAGTEPDTVDAEYMTPSTEGGTE